MNTTDFSGRIVLFFQHGKLATAFCAQQTDTQLQVHCADGHSMRLPVQRIVYSHGTAGEDMSTAGAIQHSIRAAEDRQCRLADTIEPEALWASLEDKGAGCSPDELARRAFGKDASDDHGAAVVRALHRDHLYFKFKAGRYQALSPQQVEKARERAERENERLLEIERCAEWLHAFVHGQDTAGDTRDVCAGYLRQFAVFGTGSAQYPDIRQILRRAGIPQEPGACFDLLVRMGVCSRDENLLLERYAIACDWDADALRQAGSLVDSSAGRRQDASGLEAWSIDDPGTRDIDDAISVEPDGRDVRLGIHISDVASLLPPDSPLEREAARRGTSLYLPDGMIPMLPPELSERHLSLLAGQARPVVSVYVTLGGDGTVRERAMQLSTVRVTRRLSYQDVDEDIRSGGEFRRLHEVLMRMRKNRLCAGASGMVIPELQVRVEQGREVVLSVRERETPAQALVAECMIAANHSAALFMKQHGVPALYRTQRPGRDAVVAGNRDDMPLRERLRMRQAFSRTVLSTAARSHAGLGLDCYCSTTSPIRKYLDLVMQRQLVAAIQSLEPVYSKGQLKTIAAGVEPVLTRASQVENERRRYWLLRKMEPLQGSTLRATIISRRKKGYVVLLTEFLLELNVQAPGDSTYGAGKEVQVLISAIDPFSGTISACLAGESL